ncbi:uncharacterized protein LOC119609673 [Lucilia sericata]|uniref:uncharacterized protein LOC119609673 n=1 Tax=Lucilia sericata TaxID=13632 RepID=UPI0018A85A0E|nr:uncharacterized protein LOC119609673 [Lucilia sericata]
MQKPVPNSSYYKYNLNNCHIRKTCSLRLKNEIKGKLQYLKSWQMEQSLDEKAKNVIENTIDTDYFGINSGKKVYIGFTAYARNPSNGCKEQISDTIFSNAIYDICNFSTVTPSFATTAGRSEHIINLAITNLQQHHQAFKLNYPMKIIVGKLGLWVICKKMVYISLPHPIRAILIRTITIV